MSILFDGSSNRRSAAQHDASKQAQAGAERARSEADQHNAWLQLLRLDARACAIMEHYRQTDEQGRTDLARQVQAMQAARPRPESA